MTRVADGRAFVVLAPAAARIWQSKVRASREREKRGASRHDEQKGAGKNRARTGAHTGARALEKERRKGHAEVRNLGLAISGHAVLVSRRIKPADGSPDAVILPRISSREGQPSLLFVFPSRRTIGEAREAEAPPTSAHLSGGNVSILASAVEHRRAESKTAVV